MFYPGTKAAAILTINSAYVAETSAHFLCQVNASSLLLDANFKSKIVSRASILVWDMQGLTVRPSRIILDLLNNALFIYFDGAVSTTVNLQYAICVSDLFTETDSANTFNNCGIVGMWGFDGSLTDYSNGYTLSPTNFGGVYPNGAFYKSATFDANTSCEYSGSILSGRSTFSVSFIVKPTLSFTNAQILFSDREASVVRFQVQSASNKLQVYFGTISNYMEVNNADDILPIGTQSLLTITYNGSGGATNNDKVKIYVNGTLMGTTSTGTIPSVMPTYTGFLRYGWPAGSFAIRGDIDNSMIRSDVRSLNGIVTSNNMLFNTANFFTLGNPKVVSNNNSLWNKVKQRMRAGFK